MLTEKLHTWACWSGDWEHSWVLEVAVLGGKVGEWLVVLPLQSFHCGKKNVPPSHQINWSITAPLFLCARRAAPCIMLIWFPLMLLQIIIVPFWLKLNTLWRECQKVRNMKRNRSYDWKCQWRRRWQPLEVVFRSYCSYHVTSSASKISISYHSIGIDSECVVVITITLAVGQGLLLCIVYVWSWVYILNQKTKQTCGGPEIGQPQNWSVIQMKCKSCHTQSAVTAHQAAA